MPLVFSLPMSRTLLMQQGIPTGYRGALMHGSTAQYTNQDFGQIITQECNKFQYIIRYHAYQLTQQVKLYFRREETGLQTTAILQDKVRTTFTGAGRFKMREGYFSSLYNKAWEGTLECDANTSLVAFDATWTPEFLQQFLPEDNTWKRIFQKQFSGIPFLIGHPFRRITPTLKDLIRQLVYCSYDESLREQALDHLVKEYLIEVLREIDNPDWLRQTINAADLEKIEAAKSLISSDPGQHLFTTDIARQVNMSEGKLKALFVKATGMGTFDYMLYLRCCAVRDRILQTDLPLKAFVREAGYSDFANFVNGFNRHMGCSPGMIRKS